MSSMIDAVDTYVRYVRMRLQTINPSRVVKGPIDAQDWPTNPIVDGGLYLLTFTEVKGKGTATVPIYSTMLQWAWVVFGSDLCDNKRGRNRGDRYRLDYAIREELRQATYPNFASKISLSVDANNNLVAIPAANQEAIYWSQLTFDKRERNRETSVVYGYATTYVTQMTEPILA